MQFNPPKGMKKGKETVSSELYNVSPYDRAVS